MSATKTKPAASSRRPRVTAPRPKAHRFCGDHDKRWRPTGRGGGVCGYSFDGKRCSKRGSHHCEPRADKVVRFFAEILVHTKGRWARKAFDLDYWQEHDIIRPLFGEVVWSSEWGCYVRRYRLAYIIVARKNGKSELAAGILLYLLVGDDEEGAEVYGAAKDRDQAKKVWEPADRMRTLSPLLSRRLKTNKNEKRIFDEKTASYYAIITADALGELGSNPHGAVIDELLSQRDGDLFNTLRTGMGTRHQPLMLVISTETNSPTSFGAKEIDEAERVEADPKRAPHVFAYVRKTPMDADPWDEANWFEANPALGSFLSITALREEALEARNDPTKENAFRQYRLNQRVQQQTRHMPLHVWDESAGLVVEEDLAGRSFFGGLDLASTTDLAAWVLLFPDDDGDEVLWRFWTPEAQLPLLDRHTGGRASQWVKQGLLHVTEGDWIDYEKIHEQIDDDLRTFEPIVIGHDKWGAQSTVQWLQREGVTTDVIPQGYGLSAGMKEVMRLVKAGRLHHGGNPVARWNADSVEVRQDDMENIKPVKPDRGRSSARIDGYVALAIAKSAQLRFDEADLDQAGEIY